MRFILNKDEKLALLQAAGSGVLDTKKIARIADEIRGSNTFLELMEELPDLDEEDIKVVVDCNNEIRQKRGKKPIELQPKTAD